MIKICFAISLLIVVSVTNTYGQRMKQTREVVEAYQVVTEFQRLFAQDLDFERAYEATFTKVPARRRAIAIAESELGGVAVDATDDATLISIYKSQMQIFFFLLPLANPVGEAEGALFLPPEIRMIFDRKRPTGPEQLPAYAAQLKLDVERLRAHLNHLVEQQTSVVERLREFKESLKKIEPPNEVVKPLTAYARGNVLRVEDEYYQIGECVVIRENGEMRVVGMRLFWRMF